MREVDLKFLRECVDISAFGEDRHNEHNTDLIFYEKTYDGGENHEIHYIYIVGHDPNDTTKPYIIYHYSKEYMWNWHTTFEQEDCYCNKTIKKDTLSEVFYYLQENNIINSNYTTTIVEKNKFISVDDSVCKQLKYNISVDWSDTLGDYSELFTFILPLDTIDMTQFNEIHTKLIEYLIFESNFL